VFAIIIYGKLKIRKIRKTKRIVDLPIFNFILSEK
jgi:hypothetical protein